MKSFRKFLVSTKVCQKISFFAITLFLLWKKFNEATIGSQKEQRTFVLTSCPFLLRITDGENFLGSWTLTESRFLQEFVPFYEKPMLFKYCLWVLCPPTAFLPTFWGLGCLFSKRKREAFLVFFSLLSVTPHF